jgi:hypothetical protein
MNSFYGYGVEGYNPGGVGVYGTTSNTSGLAAIYGTSAYTYGVEGAGTGSNGIGVYGTASAGTGVYGSSTGNGANYYGVYGTAVYADAIHGVYTGTGGSSAVAGVAPGTGNGVYGSAANASYVGVEGYTSASAGYSALFTGGKGVNLGTSAESYYYGGLCAAGACSSDRRLKEDIKPLDGALEKILQLKGVTFKWRNPENHGNATEAQRGFIAQEVEKVFPEWVAENSEGFKTVAIQPAQMASLEIEAIRTLKAENDDLRREVGDLRSIVYSMNPDRAGFTFGNGGWGLAGVALSFALMAGRRRRDEKRD